MCFLILCVRHAHPDEYKLIAGVLIVPFVRAQTGDVSTSIG